MKKDYLRLILVIGLFGIVLSCSENGPYHPNKHKGEHQHANHHMNKTPFEDLVKRFESPDRDEWQRPASVIAFLGDLSNKTVIDIGAGTGYFEFKIKDSTAKLIAADVDERFINFMNERIASNGVKHISTRKAEYDKPPVNPNEADIVFMVDVYHHIENRKVYFAEVRKGLKAGGKLVIVDFKKGDFKQGPPDRMKLEAKQVIEEMKSAGFKLVEEDSETLSFQYMLKFE
jgi:ubiquinone/menaquinone biosynthesis C-methylase UbiE